jgi:hypothetical protein
MAYAYNYSVAGLQEPGKMNVLSLESKTAIGNTLRFDDTDNIYEVLWCDEPQPTEFDAARLAIDGRISLKVAPISRAKSKTQEAIGILPIDEWNSETSLIYEVVGERQDDLPCYECGYHTDTLIVKTGTHTSRDICRCCAIMLGIRFR